MSTNGSSARTEIVKKKKSVFSKTANWPEENQLATFTSVAPEELGVTEGFKLGLLDCKFCI